MTRTEADFADLTHMTNLPTADECVAALGLRLAEVTLERDNLRTERDAAHAEVAELRDHRTATMAEALGVTTTTTRIGMLR